MWSRASATFSIYWKSIGTRLTMTNLQFLIFSLVLLRSMIIQVPVGVSLIPITAVLQGIWSHLSQGIVAICVQGFFARRIYIRQSWSWLPASMLMIDDHLVSKRRALPICIIIVRFFRRVLWFCQICNLIFVVHSGSSWDGCVSYLLVLHPQVKKELV